MKKQIIKFLLAGLAVLIVLILYGILIEPRLIDTEEEIAQLPNLPPDWQGKRIAVIGDFQVGMWMANTATIRRIASQLAEERPEAVLMLGDFIYHAAENPAQEMQKVLALLQPLTDSGIPLYTVLGNHDYGMPTKEDKVHEDAATVVRNALEGAGIRVLQNEAVPLPLTIASQGDVAQGESLYLVGLGARYPGYAQPEAALGQLPPGAARLVIMHHPDSFEDLPANAAPLAVAGHTHGGQIRIPFTSGWSWMRLTRDDEVHADGWIQGYGAPGNRLYVNRGIGFSVFPIRINCPPEITMFTLRKK